MTGDIARLMHLVAQHYVFNEETYPELVGRGEKEKLAFAIQHSALHFSKTAGKIAAVAEDMHHGAEPDLEDLKKNIPKALINAFRLAELVGMSEKDIVRAIEEKYKKKLD